jgi:hypothetical protein
MKRETKTKKATDWLANYLKQAGHEEEAVKEAISSAPTTKDAVSLQGEAVLLYIEKPARFTMKKCKRCKEVFGTNYRYVSYCSNNCMAKGFQKETGIQWNWHRSPEDAWGGEQPLIIPPAALKRLKHFAELVLYYHQLVQNQTEIRHVGRVEAGKQFYPEELTHLLALAQQECQENSRNPLPSEFQEEQPETTVEESHQLTVDLPTIPVASPQSSDFLLLAAAEDPFQF